MGLDQWAFIKLGDAPPHITDPSERAEYEFENFYVMLKQWRKHPNLQGWMERCWREKNGTIAQYESNTLIDDPFNGVELELTLDDIYKLETAVMDGTLTGGFGNTKGFFFGEPTDREYRYDDLNFCKNARVALKNGLRVVYDSSW